MLLIGQMKAFEPQKFGSTRTVMALWLMMQVMQETEEQQRAGMTFMMNADGIKWKNWHTETQKKMMSQIQVQLPIDLFSPLTIQLIFTSRSWAHI